MKSVKIRRIGVLSLAKIQGMILAFFGLIIGLIYGAVIMLITLVAAQQPGPPGGPNPNWIGGAGIVGGLLAIIFFPIIYGVFGFISGALTALIYNLAAGSVGGLELDLEGPPSAEPTLVARTY